MPGLMSGDWKRSTVSGPQRLQPDAWTAPDLTATAPAPDSTQSGAQLRQPAAAGGLPGVAAQSALTDAGRPGCLVAAHRWAPLRAPGAGEWDRQGGAHALLHRTPAGRPARGTGGVSRRTEPDR